MEYIFQTSAYDVEQLTGGDAWPLVNGWNWHPDGEFPVGGKPLTACLKSAERSR